MLELDLIITNKLGLHTRAASKIINITKKHHSNIFIECNNTSVDGKSIIGLLTLAATQNSIITLIIDGKDEEILLTKLKTLIQNKFDEDE
tara:strand:+ start:4016 stop:4285 length:270 start_codon:yes stop_codon:yes gene_type:complete